MFDDKVILITGGTGSFGNAALEKFLDSNAKEIRILSRDEKKQDDIRKKYKNSNPDNEFSKAKRDNSLSNTDEPATNVFSSNRDKCENDFPKSIKNIFMFRLF